MIDLSFVAILEFHLHNCSELVKVDGTTSIHIKTINNVLHISFPTSSLNADRNSSGLSSPFPSRSIHSKVSLRSDSDREKVRLLLSRFPSWNFSLRRLLEISSVKIARVVDHYLSWLLPAQLMDGFKTYEEQPFCVLGKRHRRSDSLAFCARKALSSTRKTIALLPFNHGLSRMCWV